MLLYWWYLHVFYILYVIFMHFLELTYWRDATVPVPIFCCFWFQKSYIGNILRIGRNKLRSSYFHETKTESEGESKTSHRAATPGPGAAWPWPAPGGGVGPLASADFALPPTYSPSRENPKYPSIIPRKVLSRPSSPTLVRGTEVSVPAPCRDGELPPEPSPSTPPPSSSPLLTPMMRRE